MFWQRDASASRATTRCSRARAYAAAIPIQAMRVTPLDKPLRREVAVNDALYTLTIDPQGMKLVEKGKRKGMSLAWTDLLSGDAGLAVALQASVAGNKP